MALGERGTSYHHRWRKSFDIRVAFSLGVINRPPLIGKLTQSLGDIIMTVGPIKILSFLTTIVHVGHLPQLLLLRIVTSFKSRPMNRRARTPYFTKGVPFKAGTP